MTPPATHKHARSLSRAPWPAGQLQLHSVSRAPADLLRPLPGAPTTSLAAHLRQLESFPGPLGSGTHKDKVTGGGQPAIGLGT